MIFQSQTRPPSSSLSYAPPIARRLLQRKCACGGTPGPDGECAECKRKRLSLRPKLTINQPGDRLEQEADRVAEAVIRGVAPMRGSISSLGSDAVQREETAKPTTEEEKYKEAAKKVGEAFLGTAPGKEIKKKAEELGDAFISTLPGKVITGAAVAGAVAPLTATHKELPIGIPEIPLDTIKPGLKMKITYKGPVDKPTKVVATFSFGLGAGKAREKKPALTESEKSRAETARMAAEQAKFREGLKTPEEKAVEQRMFDAYIRTKRLRPDQLTPRTAPLSFGVGGEQLGFKPGLPPAADRSSLGPWAPGFKLTGEAPAGEQSAQEELKKKEEETLQRKAASDHEVSAAPPIVNEVLQSQGQPLDPATRTFMEARFGHEFSHVRIHTDSRAAQSADSVDAVAYTVRADVVFATGRYAPNTPAGRWLLAHELSHVLQQSAGTSPAAAGDPVRAVEVKRLEDEAQKAAKSVTGAGATAPAVSPAVQPPSLQRLTAYEFFANIPVFGLLVQGLFEGDFSEETLRDYLNDVDKRNAIEGKLNSDNKARAVVRRWKADPKSFDLTTAKRKRLLVMEMLDGRVTDGDREGILDLLADCAVKNVPLDQLFQSGGIKFNELYKGLDKEPYHTKFATLFTPWFLAQQFAESDRPLAGRILHDLFAVVEEKPDFADLGELRTEVFKRLRTSQLMRESQNVQAFDYPENMRAGDCPDYDASYPMKNARVNLAAHSYWSDVVLDNELVYYFKLTPLGKQHGFDALTKLFTPQGPGRQNPDDADPNICKKTLIHCDYLVNVIHYRTYAETIGAAKFDRLVKDGAIDLWLTYTGFPKPNVEDWRKSPKALSVQEVRPASERDLVIGDHVMFWNHLAYDGLNTNKHGPWRLENAVLVDVDASGRDLFQGHGTTERIRDQMHKDLADNYNPFAVEAIGRAGEVKNGTRPMSYLTDSFPNVEPGAGDWVVVDPGLYGDNQRKGKRYKLRTVTDWVNDPEMPGLHDPHDRDKMGTVKRPVESAERPPPKI